MDCGSVTFVFSSNKPEVVGGVDVPCMSRFSNNLCGSDLYIIYCLINSGVQTLMSEVGKVSTRTVFDFGLARPKDKRNREKMFNLYR